MKKLLSTALSLALALSLACCAGLAEETEGLVEHFSLPEPQDLATLFPGEIILTKDFGDFTISYPESWNDRTSIFARSKAIRLCLTDEQTHLEFQIWFIEDSDTPALNDAYVADMNKKLIEERQTTEQEQYILDCIEYYRHVVIPARQLSSAVVDFNGRPAYEQAYHSYYISMDVALWVYSARAETEEYSEGDESLGLGVRLDRYVPVQGEGYWHFFFLINNTRDRAALADSVEISSILNTVKWKE